MATLASNIAGLSLPDARVLAANHDQELARYLSSHPTAQSMIELQVPMHKPSEAHAQLSQMLRRVQLAQDGIVDNMR